VSGEHRAIEGSQDVSRLREAYGRYRKEMLAVAYHYTGDLMEAEDITQEVFLRYGQALSRLLPIRT